MSCQRSNLPVDNSAFEGNDALLENYMSGIAKLALAEPLGASDVQFEKPVRIAKETYSLDCVCNLCFSDDVPYVVRSYLCRLYLSPSGMYFIYADDTEAGRSLIESAVFTPAAE
ncbi:MAG: hypothetical protein PHI27_13165 [Eubacteriales bacterium]|nr:hypothetical protein [Eubacteriales bacterium]MDD3883173.1 hypothetical protein [Eubacteriales bacterium]MDD4512444.1 hypothetical protein [Eubacteriales bacterium]